MSIAEERWCADCRRQVADYLTREGVTHGAIGDWPAWHLEPYVSVWAIESAQQRGAVGWWVICGDLPTDYESSAHFKDPRSFVAAIAQRWLRAVPYLEQGTQAPDVRIGTADNARALAPLLRARADLLAEWVADETLWNADT